MPLVIKRRVGESVMVDGLEIQVSHISGQTVKLLYIDPPDGREPPRIDRKENAVNIPALRALHGLSVSPPPADAACLVDPHGHDAP